MRYVSRVVYTTPTQWCERGTAMGFCPPHVNEHQDATRGRVRSTPIARAVHTWNNENTTIQTMQFFFSGALPPQASASRAHRGQRTGLCADRATLCGVCAPDVG